LSAASALVSIQDLQSRSGSVLLASEEADAIKRQAIEQTMERLPHGARRLAVQLRTPIKEAVLWEVLTDYDHLSDFIPNLASSTVVARKEKRVQLNQVGSQQLLGLRFSAQVQLELVEDRAKGQLKFHMIKGDFRRFEGNWIMRDLDRGTSLLYELTVQGCVGMPVGLIEQRLRDDLAANLLAVEKEALRRQTLV
jgi:ribosome-associated toxin RatA of RatAB toxin-antitoxin module